MKQLSINVYESTLEELHQMRINGTLVVCKNNPKMSKKAIKSLLKKPLIASSLDGMVFYKTPESGVYEQLDGNTRCTYIPQRPDWDSVKNTVVVWTLITDPQERLAYINVKHKALRGAAPNQELAVNPEFPCGKFLQSVIKKLEKGFTPETVDLMKKLIEKSPQALFDVLFHIRAEGGVFLYDEYNRNRSHHSNTSKLVEAGPFDTLTDHLDSFGQIQIEDAVRGYASLLEVQKYILGQNTVLDELLGVTKARRPGFFVCFLADRMSKGSFVGFSTKTPERLMQSLRRAGTAYTLNSLVGELLRNSASIPR